MPIKPKAVAPETQALIDNVEQATAKVNKNVCTEIKNFGNPTDSVKQVVITFANFIEGRSDHTWVTSKGKLYDFIRRGVGARDRVTD